MLQVVCLMFFCQFTFVGWLSSCVEAERMDARMHALWALRAHCVCTVFECVAQACQGQTSALQQDAKGNLGTCLVCMLHVSSVCGQVRFTCMWEISTSCLSSLRMHLVLVWSTLRSPLGSLPPTPSWGETILNYAKVTASTQPAENPHISDITTHMSRLYLVSFHLLVFGARWACGHFSCEWIHYRKHLSCVWHDFECRRGQFERSYTWTVSASQCDIPLSTRIVHICVCFSASVILLFLSSEIWLKWRDGAFVIASAQMRNDTRHLTTQHHLRHSYSPPPGVQDSLATFNIANAVQMEEEKARLATIAKQWDALLTRVLEQKGNCVDCISCVNCNCVNGSV